ncbi:xanthine dehydrogenase YagR molybdenum-binding subunit [Saccharopolyspora lacisalsi]|uniref:Xanthine dehydrogenase YagR molybdenum-binding subunit n=1 Tax=Halosaccharopolyspora lacisalsi TaxID=1000566 RepID=A0A839DYP8_9PSEU|nr:xanthine dehydrogenase family protein molybdopterin-binding subunit [Halosaccharopolyspora lacisalsi]MBA8824495.1 xanthine dehydrogenase YagR molybdenum-binding subunit [Halosaccharopolyspora lacisalsi]
MTGVLNTVGAPLERLEGPAKVTGTATYAFEHRPDDPVYLHPLQATIARGRVTNIDTAAAESLEGVHTVLTHTNAERLASTPDSELAVLQSDEVGFRGQLIGAVLADTPETAHHAASLIGITYERHPHDAAFRDDSDVVYTHDGSNPMMSADLVHGDVDTALAAATFTLDATYTTPAEYNNPMEPHATIACWQDGELTLHDSNQGSHVVRAVVAPLLGVEPERVHVISPHVGGGFGAKGMPHSHVILVALAAKALPGRSVKCALTRQHMFSLVGYRPPTVQRIRLGADSEGRLTATGHDSLEQTARIKEFADQSANASRNMYVSPNRHITNRLAALDVPPGTWMRGPGETGGMYALETAMDEMAQVCGVDPIEFRLRNEPESDPSSGLPFSSRNLVACLREGAEKFGWRHRDPTPGVRREGDWLIGTGVAASTFPTLSFPGSMATIRCCSDGRYRVDIGASDLGTGARTALSQIAAEALEVSVEAVDLHLGSTTQPFASLAGGSAGTASWGSAIVHVARTFREEHGSTPEPGAETTATAPPNPAAGEYSMHAYGAQFAEVRVHADTGEIRVPRLLGVFAAGRIINPRTAHSQFLGGMTMGVSMALHEHSVTDERFGHVVNQDFAGYHIASNADIGSIEATWLDEYDPHVNPMGSKGIGEVGIVGTAAAVGNAAHHATGIRVRELPLTPDKFLISP